MVKKVVDLSFDGSDWYLIKLVYYLFKGINIIKSYRIFKKFTVGKLSNFLVFDNYLLFQILKSKLARKTLPH